MNIQKNNIYLLTSITEEYMFDFSNIEFKRLIVHKILQKQINQENSTAELENELIPINPDIISIIQRRLIKSTNSQSKSFKLYIEKYGTGSFFDYVQQIRTSDDNRFVEISQKIALLLARSQDKNNIPGGYLLVIEASYQNKSISIVMKAELQEAVIFNKSHYSRLELLNDVFLSPEQKLIKIGMIWEDENENEVFPNNKFSCYLFDKQYSPDYQPAEYFYKDFLGFSTEKNSKIQTKRFFDNTESFIRTYIDEPDSKNELLNALKEEFITNRQTEIKPADFGYSYFQDEDIQEIYNNEIVSFLPENIEKDSSLIINKLKKRNLSFPNKISLSGPDKIFDLNVKIIKDISEISDSDDSNYTIIRIKGKPFED